jgi:adenine phosphoribosyltransferase
VDHPLRSRLIDAFRWIDLGPDVTHLVSDVSGWWRDHTLLAGIGPALGDLFRSARPQVVVAPETGGFLVGPLVATSLGAGFVEAYKNTRTRQIADVVRWRQIEPDYRDRTLSLGIRARHLSPGDRVLVVDDWADTGAQLTALRELIQDLGAEYLGAAVIVDGCDRPAREALNVRGLLSRSDLVGPD